MTDDETYYTIPRFITPETYYYGFRKGETQVVVSDVKVL